MKKPPVPLERLARRLKVSVACLELWVRTGRLEAFCHRGRNKRERLHVGADYAVAIVRDWQGSCTFVKGAKFLRVSTSWLNHAIASGCGETRTVLGLRRLSRSSLPILKERRRKIRAELAHPKLKGFARYAPKKIRELALRGAALGGHTSGSQPRNRKRALERGQFFKKLKQPFPKIREKLVEIKLAASLLGVSETSIARWIASGQLKVSFHRGRRMVFVSLIKRLRKNLGSTFKSMAS